MTEQVRRPAVSRSITAEIERLRARNAELLEALQAVARAESLEAAQEIACAAIAVAIARES